MVRSMVLTDASRLAGQSGFVAAQSSVVGSDVEYGCDAAGVLNPGCVICVVRLGHTCQPYRIFRENHGKLTSIPVYRGIYKIYRIFKKSNVPPQAAIVHVRSTLNHVLTRYYHEYLPAFLLEIEISVDTCRLKACYLNRLPLLWRVTKRP